MARHERVDYSHIPQGNCNSGEHQVGKVGPYTLNYGGTNISNTREIATMWAEFQMLAQQYSSKRISRPSKRNLNSGKPFAVCLREASGKEKLNTITLRIID